MPRARVFLRAVCSDCMSERIFDVGSFDCTQLTMLVADRINYGVGNTRSLRKVYVCTLLTLSSIGVIYFVAHRKRVRELPDRTSVLSISFFGINFWVWQVLQDECVMIAKIQTVLGVR